MIKLVKKNNLDLLLQLSWRPDLAQINWYSKSIHSKKEKIHNILEIGSRDGHDTKYISKIFKSTIQNASIIEAHPELFQQIKKTYPLFNILNYAASDSDGYLKFNAILNDGIQNVGASSVLKNIIFP